MAGAGRAARRHEAPPPQQQQQPQPQQQQQQQQQQQPPQQEQAEERGLAWARSLGARELAFARELGAALAAAAASAAPGPALLARAGETGPICAQVLGTTRRLAALPNVTVLAQPVAMVTDTCGFKASCCDIPSFNEFGASFSSYDRWYDGLLVSAERVRDYPGELLSLMVRLTSRKAWSTGIDLEVLAANIAEHTEHLATSIDNQNVLVRFNTFYNLLQGYFTGLLCAMCDPFHKLYATREAMPAGSADEVRLLLHRPFCSRLGAALTTWLDLVELFVSDQRNFRAVHGAMDELCDAAAPPRCPCGPALPQPSRAPAPSPLRQAPCGRPAAQLRRLRAACADKRCCARCQAPA